MINRLGEQTIKLKKKTIPNINLADSTSPPQRTCTQGKVEVDSVSVVFSGNNLKCCTCQCEIVCWHRAHRKSRFVFGYKIIAHNLNNSTDLPHSLHPHIHFFKTSRRGWKITVLKLCRGASSFAEVQVQGARKALPLRHLKFKAVLKMVQRCRRMWSSKSICSSKS